MLASNSESDSVNRHVPQYEELVTGVNCPTCNGTGKVPRDSEREYIALIPLSDKRLKPRRTVLWVSVTASLCALVLIGTFCSLFFLLPRSIELTSTKPPVQPYSVAFNRRDDLMTLDVENFVNLTNDNYFGITVSKIEMAIVYVDTSLCEATNTSLTISVGPRSVHRLSSRVTCRVDSPESLVRFCSLPIEENLIYLRFNFAVTSTYMLDHREEATLSVVQIVNCTSTVGPVTIRPPMTTTTTTTTTTEVAPKVLSSAQPGSSSTATAADASTVPAGASSSASTRATTTGATTASTEEVSSTAAPLLSSGP